MRPESRKSLLAKIHIAKKDLGLDDDTYRLRLERLTGKTSARDLTVPQLARIVADLRVPGLAALGLRRSQVDEAAEAAMRASSMKGNPIVLTHDEVAEIIETSM